LNESSNTWRKGYFEGQPSDTWTISIIKVILIRNVEEILIGVIEEILKK